MAKQVPWDDETDGFIADLDQTVQEKYNISLRSLLLNPDKFLERKDLPAVLSGIKDDSTAYFTELLNGLADEQTKLQSEMESADAQYRSVDSVITDKSAAARVPYIKPLFVSRDPDREEVVLIDKYDESMEGFVGKLVMTSVYVADVSTLYKNYRLGSWLFSGPKNHVLTINSPASPVLIIENSQALIDNMLDDIQSRAGE